MILTKDNQPEKTKKIKKNIITSDDNSSISNNNFHRSNRDKKPNQIEDLGYTDKDKSIAAKNPGLFDVYKKCEKALQKIRKNPLADYYNNSNNENIPSLSSIEKKMKNYEFTSCYVFTLEVRKIWSYYFANYSNNPDVYQKTMKMSEYSEEAMKDMEVTEDKGDAYNELSKKVAKLRKDMNDIKTHPNNTPVQKKVEKLPICEKPLTPQEKNQLGNSIRSLTPDQLKGIVNILADSLMVDRDKKFFEFDIELLSTRKLRELDKYVKSCMKKGDTKPKPIITENEKIEKLKVSQS
jgi:hypothetical protein